MKGRSVFQTITDITVMVNEVFNDQNNKVQRLHHLRGDRWGALVDALETTNFNYFDIRIVSDDLTEEGKKINGSSFELSLARELNSPVFTIKFMIDHYGMIVSVETVSAEKLPSQR